MDQMTAPSTPAPTAAPPTGEITSAPMSSAPEAAAPKRGAPEANGNHLAAGLHADPQKQLVRLVLGSLGDSQARVETDAYSYRRTLEEACLEANGEITLVHAHAIDAATRWMRHGQLALAWLREHEPKMDHAQRLAYSKAIAEAADRRDKSVERLKLDRDAEDVAANFYASLQADIDRKRLERQAAAANEPLRPSTAEYARPLETARDA